MMKKNILDKFFDPRSVAIIGAKDDKGSVGFGLVNNLIKRKNKRNIYFVNPFHEQVAGKKTYPKVTDIKEKVDLAIIAVPVPSILEVAMGCIQKKVGGVMVITAGFAESGERGKKVEDDLAGLLEKENIPLLGPNCLGILNAQNDLNASFASLFPRKGSIAFLSQSGALLNTFMDMANSQGLGFSKLVSYGNEADLDLADFIDYLGKDEDTKVICFYVEAIKDGQKFMKIASRVSKIKPLIAIKSGRSKLGQVAAATHTGSIAGNYQIYETAFRQSGVMIADSIEEVFDLAKALIKCPRCQNGVGIVTNGGGAGVLAVDYCEKEGIMLPEVGSDKIREFDKKNILKSLFVIRNPLDLIGDALPDRYLVGIESFLVQERIKAVLVIETTQAMTDPLANAKNIIRLKKRYPLKPIICCFLGGNLVHEAVELLEKNNVPNYSELKRAVRVIRNLIKN
jgi:acetyltransferase